MIRKLFAFPTIIPFGLGIIALLIALIITINVIPYALSRLHYQQGSCTIESKELQYLESTTTDDNGIQETSEVYRPYFSFAVHTANGQTYQAQGYDGAEFFTNDRAAQQAVVNQYHVGENYPCWYDPQKPTNAVLVQNIVYLVPCIPIGIILIIGIVLILVSVKVAKVIS